jgi:hypothetical protein
MTRHALAVLTVACLVHAGAAAQDATLTIAGEIKPTVGTVVELVNADTACNVELRDDAGRTHHELADFDLCFQQPALRGRRVALSWTVGDVMAESCGGDPECGESERIALIASARILDDARAAAPADAPCAADEQVVFACRTGAKQVAVCASKDAAPTSGYVQYRFGRPGQPPELELPAERIPPAGAATADNVPFSGGGASWMRFRRGDHAYVVYTGIGQWGPQGEVEERAGIVVERRGARIATLVCDSGQATGELGPDWFERVGVGANGEAFELPL